MLAVGRVLTTIESLRRRFDLSPRDAALITLLLVVSAIACAVAGGWVAIPAVIGSVIVIALAGRALAAPGDRRFVVGVAVALLLAREVFAAALHLVLVATGHNGALFLDDAGYVLLASALADRWHGVAVDPRLEEFLNDTTTTNAYVYFAAALFSLTGPVAIVLKIVNCVFGVLCGLFGYRFVRNVSSAGARWTLVLILVFPSLVLWSALTLKDSYVLCFAMAAMWATSEVLAGRSLRWLLAAAAALLVMENTRPYLFVILVLAWPVSMLIAARGRRLRVAASALGLAALLLFTTGALSVVDAVFGTNLDFASLRSAMSANARTAFVDPAPAALVAPGDRLVVVVPGVTPAVDTTPRVIEIRPGTDLVVERSGTPAPTVAGRPTPAIVRAGDIVVIVSPSPSPPPPTVAPSITPAPSPTPPPTTPTPIPLPTTEPRPVTISAIGRNLIASAPPPRVTSNEALTIGRNIADDLAHLPIGFFYLAAAPFPWSMGQAADLAALPEVLFLYAVELLAAYGIWLTVRRRQLGHVYPTLVALGLILVFSLAEGTIGTLIRHRAMLLPQLCIFAGVALSELIARRPRRAA